MRLVAVCAVASVMTIGSAAVLAQDPVTVDPAHYKVVLENAAVRVLNITYGVGEKSSMHQHPESIAVALSAASARFTLPDGKTQDSELVSETALYMPAGPHSPANIGKSSFRVIQVEFKGAAPGTAAVVPPSRPGIETKTLAEGARATAYRSTAAADFVEPAGTTHEFDQIVIALGPGQLTLSREGQPAKTNWVRGDVEFIGRGVKHETRNTGGKPLDFILIAIK
jgi:quercetin dioxygenase-like cupin family protein